MRRKSLIVITLVIALFGVLVLGSYAAAAVAVQAAPAAQATATATPAATPGKQDAERPRTERKLQLRSDRGWLGVQIQSVEGGAEVRAVTADSPAAAAGVMVGDVVTRANDRDVRNTADLLAAVREVKPGDSVRLTLRRGNETVEVQVQAGEWPATTIDVPPIARSAPLGGVLPLLPGLRELEGIPAGEAFSHFLGGQYSFTDRNGQAFTVRLTPGEVLAVSADSVQVRVNGPAGEQKTFRADDNTRVHPGGNRTQGLAVGDKVVVVTVGDSDLASTIAKAGAAKLQVPAGPRFRFEMPREGLEQFFRELPRRIQPPPTPSRQGAGA
jgi:hypothetical protein